MVFLYLLCIAIQMKEKATLTILISLFVISLSGQVERAGAGLAFGNKIRFNNGDTGNPALNLKTWVRLGPESNFHIVPGVTAFNPGQIYKNGYWVNNYRFHGDIDLQYMVFHEKTLKVVAIAGLNYSYLYSTNDNPDNLPISGLVDSTAMAFGPSLGAGLEMRVRPHWDFIVSAKYTAAGINPADLSSVSLFKGTLSDFIISVHGVFYFYARGKDYRR